MELSRIPNTPQSSSPIEGVARPPAPPEVGAAGAAAATPRDQVKVSNEGRALGRADAAVDGAPDIRFDVVSRLRAAVKSGEYQVDAEAVARAIVEHDEQS